MIKIPPYLKKGDTIGITCPAGYMAAEKVQTCIEVLKQWGYKVKTGNTVGGSSTTYFSNSDEGRLAELQQMLDDKNIKAILLFYIHTFMLTTALLPCMRPWLPLLMMGVIKTSMYNP